MTDILFSQIPINIFIGIIKKWTLLMLNSFKEICFEIFWNPLF
jgi:hypothetical protein